MVYLLAHKFFVTSENLLEELFRNYHEKPSAKDKETPYDLDTFETNLHNRRIRIAKLLRLWLMNYFEDFVDNPALLFQLKSLVKDSFEKQVSLKSLGEEVLLMIKVYSDEFSSDKIYVALNTSPPDPIVPDGTSIDSFHPAEMARQLTLYCQHLLRAIPVRQFLSDTWFKNSNAVPNFKRYMYFALDISDWTASMILQRANLKERVSVRFSDISLVVDAPTHL